MNDRIVEVIGTVLVIAAFALAQFIVGYLWWLLLWWLFPGAPLWAVFIAGYFTPRLK